MEIKPDAIIFCNHTVVLSFPAENIPREKEFWVEFVYGRGYVKFHQLDATPADFVAVEVVSGYFPDLHPKASIQGVLWSRQAAIQADLRIPAFEAGLGRGIEKSSQTQA